MDKIVAPDFVGAFAALAPWLAIGLVLILIYAIIQRRSV